MLGKNRVSRETRICDHPDCSNTFEVRVTSNRKFCCISCGSRGRKHSDEEIEKQREITKLLWQDPEYKRIQHEARLGRVGGWNRGLTQETDPRVAAQAEKISGSTQSKETKAKKSKKLKGKSYVELHGKEKAKEIIKKKSEAIRGEKNYNWQGGISENPYPEEFVRVRKEIKTRDDHRCQLYGKTGITEKKEIGSGLSVHHIDYNKQNCKPENLITLCCSCNGKVNANREYWKIFFRDRLQEGALIL